jgi:hypothetical protein
MTLDMRNRAQAGLQTKPQPLGTASQQVANDQAMSTAAATTGGGAAAVGNAGLPVLAPPASVTAPILPGGIERIAPPPREASPPKPPGIGLPPR